PMEPRVSLGRIGEDGRLTLHSSHQSPFLLRNLVAGLFKLPKDQVHVILQDVGGSFGMKSGLQREDALVLLAARRLNRPVKWTSDRSEAFLSDEQARDVRIRATLGLDAEGRFTALKVEYDI